MDSANAPSNTNLPVLLAGGGFRHGQHLAFDTRRNFPLSNLFVSMVQRLGIEADRFASSTGPMRGLEMAGKKGGAWEPIRQAAEPAVSV